MFKNKSRFKAPLAPDIAERYLSPFGQDVECVKSFCAYFETTGAIAFADLSGVNITSYDGTATLSKSGNSIVATGGAGTAYNLLLSDGTLLPLQGSAYDISGNDNHGTANGDVDLYETQDSFHYNLENGFDLYRNDLATTPYANSDHIWVPWVDGLPVVSSVTGYTKIASQPPAEFKNGLPMWHNGCETVFRFPSGSIMDKSDSPYLSGLATDPTSPTEATNFEASVNTNIDDGETITFESSTDEIIWTSLGTATISGGTATKSDCQIASAGSYYLRARYGTTVYSDSLSVTVASADYPHIISASGYFTLGVINNTLYAWGENGSGQLGDGTQSDKDSPNPVDVSGVMAGKVVIQVANGASHSVALCSDGTLHAWGSNSNGQLGDGTTTQRLKPVAVDTGVSSSLNGKTVVYVSGGFMSTNCVCSDGTLHAWGSNSSGQLGDGTTTRRLSPVVVNTGAISGKYGRACCMGAGNAYYIASNSPPSISLPLNNAKIMAFSQEGGDVYGCGLNRNGGLADGTSTQHTTTIAINKASSSLNGKTVKIISSGYDSLSYGEYHDKCCVICTDGTTHIWGFTVTGNGSTATRTYATEVSGSSGNPDVTSSINEKTPEHISKSNGHFILSCSDGTLHAWGYNGSGQLGDGTTTQRTKPVAVDLSGV